MYNINLSTDNKYFADAMFDSINNLVKGENPNGFTSISMTNYEDDDEEFECSCCDYDCEDDEEDFEIVNLTELDMPLLTKKYTKIFHEPEYNYNVPNHFIVTASEMEECDCGEGYRQLAEINFQEGAIKEHGVNGVANEDLINMVIKRLECFQDSEYRCRENALAITKLEEALHWLRHRTIGREKRNVEGTSEV